MSNWTDADKALLRKLNHLSVEALVPILKRSASAINDMRASLGLSKHHGSMKRFTEDEDRYIRDNFLNSVPIEDIAAGISSISGHVRTVGTLRQRILRLGLNRDGRRTRMIKRYGPEMVPHDKTIEEIRAELKAAAAADRLAHDNAHAEQVNAALDRMIYNLRNHPVSTSRQHEFKQAMIAGATLEDIGSRVGISRERVRQVIAGIKPKYAYVRVKDRPGYVRPDKGKPKPRRHYPKAVKIPLHAEPYLAQCVQCHEPFTYLKSNLGAPRLYCLECHEIRKVDNFLAGYENMRAKLFAQKQKLEAIQAINPYEVTQCQSQTSSTTEPDPTVS